MHVPITLLGHEGGCHHVRGLHVGHDLLTKSGPAQGSEGRGLMLVMAELELLLLQTLLPFLLHLLLCLLLRLNHTLGGSSGGGGGGRGGRGGGTLVLLVLLALSHLLLLLTLLPCGTASLLLRLRLRRLRLRVVLHGSWGAVVMVDDVCACVCVCDMCVGGRVSNLRVQLAHTHLKKGMNRGSKGAFTPLCVYF